MTETRVDKAQRLVDEGRIEIWGKTEYATRAYVNEDQRQYLTILYLSGGFWCECNLVNSRTDDLCVHALAVKLAVEKEQVP